MPALFEAYVTNLGKYNEGELVGEYLKFPTTPEEVQALLKRIGIDGVRYEEIFITDFDGDVLGLYDHLGEYENIDELNPLKTVELSTEQNYNMIDGLVNNSPALPPQLPEKELDKVKEPPPNKHRSREREER